MNTLKRLGVGIALTFLGGVFLAGCNDDSCLSACQHELGCIPDGGAALLGPTYCQDSCNDLTDAGTTCKNLGAAFECINGLSCADIRGTGEGPTDAYFACVDKAECPDGGN